MSIFRTHTQTPPVVMNLIIANVVVFLAQMFFEPEMVRFELFALDFRAGAQQAWSEFIAYASQTDPTWLQVKFQWWQPFTYMFMHGGFSHLFFNMFSLWMFGRTLELDLGPKRYIIYYLVCGLGAVLIGMGVATIEWLSVKASLAETAAAYGVSAAQLANKVFTNYSMLGASGAVMGVVLSFGVMHPNSVVMLMFPPIPLKARWLVVIFIAVEFIAGVKGVNDNVGHFGHLGGMLWGWLLLRYWKKTHQIYY